MDKLGCVVSSTMMFFIGCSSAYRMAAVSLERFYIIYRPLSIRKLSFKVTYGIIILCFLNGLFWAVMPLVGWSYYTLEDGLVSCCVEFKGKTWNARSFIIAIFIFVYLIPFGIITFANILLFIIVVFF